MQITYKNHPILHKLETGDLGNDIAFYQSDFDMDFAYPLFKEIWAAYAEAFKNEVFYVTEQFAKEIGTKVMLMTNDEGSPSISGREISKTKACGTFIRKHYAFCYFSDPIHNAYILFGFSEDIYFKRWVFDTVVFDWESFTPQKLAWSTIHNGDGTRIPLSDRTPRAIDKFAQILATRYFVENVQTKTKVMLPPKSKTKHDSQLHKNETSFGVTVLDAHWFTTIIQPHPFNVKGHIRKQRCGPGWKQVKDVYIETFEKRGYTSKFKKK